MKALLYMHEHEGRGGALVPENSSLSVDGQLELTGPAVVVDYGHDRHGTDANPGLHRVRRRVARFRIVSGPIVLFVSIVVFVMCSPPGSPDLDSETCLVQVG